MAAVFTELCASTRRERGRVGLVLLWIREAVGLVRFSLRDWRDRTPGLTTRPPSGGRPPISTDLRWAWRSLRARGWSAVLSIALIAFALSGNALVFAVADSWVYRRDPYPDIDRLVWIQDVSTSRPMSSMNADLLEAWRRQSDVFQAVHGYNQRTLFLAGDGAAERVTVLDVTPGLMEMLGGTPRWGRSLSADDGRATDVDVVVLSEGLARERFGDPARAIGQRLGTTDRPLLIVGVAAGAFRYPTGLIRLWRAIDPRGELTGGGKLPMMTIAKLADGLSFESARLAVAQRSSGIGREAGRPANYTGGVDPIASPASPTQRRRYMLLLGAALALLLTACANVASLELAAVGRRARVFAIQVSLGASRARLVRGALLEGALFLTAAGLLGVGLAYLGSAALESLLPERLTLRPTNPIDFDVRALVFMVGIALVTWLAVTIPLALHASRPNVLDLLKHDSRSQSASGRTSRLRQALTMFEVAAAVVLLVGGALYARTYLAMVRVDKGFDSTNLASLTLIVPPQMLGQRAVVTEKVLTTLRALPGVLQVSDDTPPHDGDSPYAGDEFERDGQAAPDKDFAIGVKRVSPGYFSVVALPVRQGRTFQPDDLATDVVISETFARLHWPDGAIGRTFRRFSREPLNRIVGVVGDVRTEDDRWRPPTGRLVMIYSRAQQEPPRPPAPASTSPPRRRVGGPSFGFIPLLARLDAPSRLADVSRAIRATVPQFALTSRMVDEDYASWAEGSLLVTRVVGGFAGLTFLVAMAGVYGVMAFLVAGRTREIGVRMALGADRRDIRRLVFGSSLRLVFVGAAIGLAAAAAASRWIAAELFGITPTDPVTYATVALAVVAAAIFATWQPARRAALVDPAITLRNE